MQKKIDLCYCKNNIYSGEGVIQLPIERITNSLPATEVKPVRSTTTLVPQQTRGAERVIYSTIADAKEFFMDSIEDSMNVSCGGGKCLNPCVQRCLPPPPTPGRCRKV